ncbi:MAG: fumarylacetoacetate hydrolase family protein [Acidimicrobiales bacterium]
MRWSTYLSRSDGREHAGLWVDGALHGLAEVAGVLELLGDGGERMAAAATRALDDPFEVVPPLDVQGAALRPPVPVPPSIRDFMSFESHVATMSASRGGVDPGWYELPVFYFTSPAAVRGPHDAVAIAPGSSRFDYELEVAAVVGREGADLSPGEAEDHIAGYMVLCDWSARDIQAREMRQRLGPAKGKDSATSFGPYLVTPDELATRRKGASYDVAMTASVNGRPHGGGNLADLRWSFGQMLSYASRGTRVLPGDVLGSGTVGTGCIAELVALHGEGSFSWLAPGDTVHLEVEMLGAVHSAILPAAEVVPLR